MNQKQPRLSEKEKRDNRKLRRMGYGWRRTKIVCTCCRWKGRRIWGPRMFKKPCPKCKTITSSGKTTVWSPNYVITKGRRRFCQ